MIVYKTPNLRKPINYFITNMASSDLLFPIFFTPWTLSHLHTTSLLIGGPLGQAFCKPVPFFREVSFKVSIQNLVLIAVVRFGAVVFPLRSPLIRSKLCPFFILATWIVAVAISSPVLFARELVESPEGTLCVSKWEKVFGESTSLASLLLAYIILFTYIPVLLLVILYSIIVIKLKTQAHPGEQSANTQQQRKRRNRNVLQMYIAIITVFVFCWLPLSINFLIILYQHSSITHFSCSFFIYYEVTIFICFMISSNYRKALKSRREGNSIVFHLSFLFGLFILTLFFLLAFFFFILTADRAGHALGSTYILSSSPEFYLGKGILKALDLHTGQAYDQRNTISCREMSLL